MRHKSSGNYSNPPRGDYCEVMSVVHHWTLCAIYLDNGRWSTLLHPTTCYPAPKYKLNWKQPGQGVGE